MKDTVFRAIVGARGWQHPAWVSGYYPPDMPAEWRLAYYANDFTGVLIPATAWQDAPPAVWRTWHADTPPAFRFLLERVPGPPGARVPPTGLLAAKFAGWVGCSGDRDARCLTTATPDDPAADRAEVILFQATDLDEAPLRASLGPMPRSKDGAGDVEAAWAGA